MGAGSFCYGSSIDCLSGPNGCGSDAPCVVNAGFCSTSLAGQDASVVWMCPFDAIANAQPNGAGQYCYAAQARCGRRRYRLCAAGRRGS